MTISSRAKLQGIALITAMLVMALASIAAAAVLTSATAAIRRTATLIDGEKAWWYADGLESWVRAILDRDRLKNAAVDSFEEDWHRPVDYLPVEQGGLRGHIEDLQGRFNLNNLSIKGTSQYQEQFQRLFQNIEGLDASLAVAIAEGVRDWVDADQIPSGAGGAEDTDYQGLPQPYRAANQAMRSPTELLAIKGVTREIYQRLAPYVATLPLSGQGGPTGSVGQPGQPAQTGQTAQTGTAVNVNTALFPVLMSLAANVDRGRIELWLKDRQKSPAQEAKKLIADGTLPATTKPDMLSVNTSYFLMFGEAFIGSGRVALYSVMQRPQNGPPIVISRSLDTE